MMEHHDLELREAAVNGNTLHGELAYGQWTRGAKGVGWEMIAPGAFREYLRDPQADVTVQADHDEVSRRILGRRQAGTLKLEDSDDALRFDAELPDTGYARDLKALVARKDIRGASVGMRVQAERPGKAPDGTIGRMVIKAALEHVATTPRGAYAGSTIEIRDESRQLSVATRLLQARNRTRLGKPKA